VSCTRQHPRIVDLNSLGHQDHRGNVVKASLQAFAMFVRLESLYECEAGASQRIKRESAGIIVVIMTLGESTLLDPLFH
jgi:hypothetical protein